MLNPRKLSSKAGSLHFGFPLFTSQERTLHGWELFHSYYTMVEGDTQNIKQFGWIDTVAVIEGSQISLNQGNLVFIQDGLQ